MQNRVANVIRAMAGSVKQPHPFYPTIHGSRRITLNCLSKLVEKTGGTIHLDKLPVGDPPLSAKEIVGNESQERMGPWSGKIINWRKSAKLPQVEGPV